MSGDKHASNGVIRVSRKGRKRFAIGEEDDPRALPEFEVDVVVAYQKWICVDESFRPPEPNARGGRPIPDERMADFHLAAVAFVEELGGDRYAGKITTSEALDFCARLGEQYDDMADFFQRRSRQKRASLDTSEGESSDTSPTPTGLRFFDGGGLTDFGEAVLQGAMPKVQAWERLTDPEQSGKLTMDQFYELLIRAGYDEDAAQRAASKRGWDRLAAGVEM